MDSRILDRLASRSVLSTIGALIEGLFASARFLTMQDACVYDTRAASEGGGGGVYRLASFRCHVSLNFGPERSASFDYELLSWCALLLIGLLLGLGSLYIHRRVIRLHRTLDETGGPPHLWHDKSVSDTVELRVMSRFARGLVVSGIIMILAGGLNFAWLPIACDRAGQSVPSGLGSASVRWTGQVSSLVPSPECAVLRDGSPIAGFAYPLTTPAIIAVIGILLTVGGLRARSLIRRNVAL